MADSRQLKRMREEQEVDEQLRFEGVVPNDIIVYMTRFLDNDTLDLYCGSSKKFAKICKENDMIVMRRLIDKLNEKPNQMLLLNSTKKRYKFVDIKPDMDIINVENVNQDLFDHYEYVYFSSNGNPVFGGKLEVDGTDDRDHYYLYTVKVGNVKMRIIYMADEDDKLTILTNMAHDGNMLMHMGDKFVQLSDMDLQEKVAFWLTLSGLVEGDLLERMDFNMSFADGEPFDVYDNVDMDLDPFKQFIMENFSEVYKYYNLNFTTM